MSSVSVASYQLQAEVIYPVSEVQGVSMMNVFNKLFTWGISQLTTKLTDETPDHINYMFGFILWMGLPLIGLIPAFAVEEDLRRLNMKDVKESKYIHETTLKNQTEDERKEFLKHNHLVANQEVLKDLFFIMDDNRFSEQIFNRLEKMTTDEDDIRLSKRRLSGSMHSKGSLKEKPFKRLGSNVSKMTIDKENLMA